MTFSILLSRNFRFLIVFGLIAFVSATASASLIVSFETSGGTLAYGTWDTTTLSQTGVTLLPTTGDTRGLGIDGSGNVYVGRVSGSGQSTIYKYDASGALLLTSSTINATIEGFAFAPTAVPEPSSFALMMVALTGAAIGRFRKRRK